ncbi:unnamed protein product [Prorocentrum cordatum]|uniref:Uncharacterized protein n=1 Tax=Prorocentrum cordatum TaxID=2364126 RepID=A0ABN9RHX8_9DINO|nr:unnamed protein product [Polarella glacialis]
MRPSACSRTEMKAAKTLRSSTKPLKAKDIADPQLFPWRVFRGALLTGCSMWVFIMIGRVVEQTNGERQLLKQEGRVERWPSHMQPWRGCHPGRAMVPATSGPTPAAPTAACRRSLGTTGPRGNRSRTEAWSKRVALFGAKRGEWEKDAEDRAAAGAAKELLAALTPIVEALHEGARPAAQSRRAGLTWPGELRPTMLATSTRRGPGTSPPWRPTAAAPWSRCPARLAPRRSR